MAVGIESGGCHKVSIMVKRWVSSTRYHASRRTQRRHNSSHSNPSSPSSQNPPNPEAAGSKVSSSPAKTTLHTSPYRALSTGKPVSPAPRSISERIESSALGRAGDAYSRTQTRRPYLTQMVCTAVIYLIGDLNAQLLFSGDGDKSGQEGEADRGVEGTKKGGGYDPLRTLRHLSIGIAASVPSYTWFMFVHNHFNFASKVLSVAVKVVVQQVTFTPIFNIYFFSMQSLLAGATVSDTAERLKKAVPTSVINSFKLWPAVTAFSFVYVGPEFRPLFFGAIAVGWQTYLSWLNQNAARQVQITDTVDTTSHLKPALDGKL